MGGMGLRRTLEQLPWPRVRPFGRSLARSAGKSVSGILLALLLVPLSAVHANPNCDPDQILLCRDIDTDAEMTMPLQTPLTTDGDTLERAILKSDVGAVRRLLAAGADVNAIHTAKSGHRYPLVWLAALIPPRPPTLQILDLILETGRFSTAQPEGQVNSLVYVMLHFKNYGAAERVVRAGFPVEFNVLRERPMLVQFSRAGDARAVALLLDAKVDPNQSIPGGDTALMFAAIEGHLDVARLLIGRGADPRRANAKGTTALRYAEHQGRTAVADYLRSVLGETSGQAVGQVQHRDADGKPIRPRYTRNSAFAGQLVPVAGMRPPLKWQVTADPAANLSLKLGESDANHRINFEMQPRQTGPVRLSLQVIDSAGNTARTDLSLTIDDSSEILQMRAVEASKTADWNTLRNLLASYPDLLWVCVRATGQGGDGKCPVQGGVNGIRVASVVMLNAVASTDDPALLRQLLAGGANPNARSAQGVPALVLALGAGHSRMMDALLAAGADPNQPAMQGLTALHFAAMRGNVAMVQRLMAAGAKPRPDAKGHMPGYYLFWLHDGDPSLAQRLGYSDAHGYVERRRRREQEDADAAAFAKAMLQAVATAQQQQVRAPSSGLVRGTVPMGSNPLRIAEPGHRQPGATAPTGGSARSTNQQAGAPRGPCYDPGLPQSVASGKSSGRVHPSYPSNAPVLSRSDVYVLRPKDSGLSYPLDTVARKAGCLQEGLMSFGDREFYSWPVTVCGKTVYSRASVGADFLKNPKDPYRTFICRN